MTCRRKTLPFAVLLLGAGLGGASACAAGEGLVAVDWDEPGWVAQARQEVEDYQNAFVACMRANGADAEVMIGGNVIGFAVTIDEEGLPIPGIEELLENATDTCGEQVPRPAHWGHSKDEQAYERMLDVRECLIAHGHEVSEPPSLEAWLGQSPANAWNLYLDLFPGHAASPLPDDELIALLRVCPQSGFGFLSINAQPD